jgi:hypothetical protein
MVMYRVTMTRIVAMAERPGVVAAPRVSSLMVSTTSQPQ